MLPGFLIAFGMVSILPCVGTVEHPLAALFTVFFTTISIGVGLAVSRMVTDRNWLMETPHGVPSPGTCPTK